MRRTAPLFICIALLVVACRQEIDLLVPHTPGFTLPPGTQPLTSGVRSAIEGVYTITEGSSYFGAAAVLKWSYVAQGPDTLFTLSMFCGKEVSYFILDGGSIDSVFHLAGYWRRLVNTETGNALLSITPAGGGGRLLQSVPVATADSLIIRGVFQPGEGGSEKTIVLRYQRPLFRTQLFAIIAHRAGGRNSDLLPTSENTVEMVLLAERFGANGIEIDVRLTLDGVPILYHDENLNIRLNEKNGLVGSVEEYTYEQLQTFVRLLHGERIPTLREVLEAVIDRTNLRIVWLDMKSAKPSMEIVRAIQRAALLRANAQALAGRRNPLSIVIGLPTSEKVDEFLALPDHADAPALCELTPDDVRRTGAVVWAPRWTLGTQDAEAAQMRAEGRKVFMWTLDVPSYAAQFMSSNNLDGILSNYPSMIAFLHYVRP